MRSLGWPHVSNMDKDKKISQLIELVKLLNDALLEANKTLRDNNLPEVKKSTEHLFKQE